ncbi:unnamed protein product, partial [Heterosigma akashiwo]
GERAGQPGLHLLRGPVLGGVHGRGRPRVPGHRPAALRQPGEDRGGDEGLPGVPAGHRRLLHARPNAGRQRYAAQPNTERDHRRDPVGAAVVRQHRAPAAGGFF